MGVAAAGGSYEDGQLPGNVRVGPNTVVRGSDSFKRFRGEQLRALTIGSECTMDGVHFALGPETHVTIGDHCYFADAVLLSELKLSIGSFVVIGWNATITDTDFHPIVPAERIRDAVACSPLGRAPRPPVLRLPVVIEDDVWIGPNAAIMKGVRVGSGSLIEPGAVVTSDIPPFSRVMGNPAVIVGNVT